MRYEYSILRLVWAVCKTTALQLVCSFVRKISFSCWYSYITFVFNPFLVHVRQCVTPQYKRLSPWFPLFLLAHKSTNFSLNTHCDSSQSPTNFLADTATFSCLQIRESGRTLPVVFGFSLNLKPRWYRFASARILMYSCMYNRWMNLQSKVKVRSESKLLHYTRTTHEWMLFLSMHCTYCTVLQYVQCTYNVICCLTYLSRLNFVQRCCGRSHVQMCC